MNIIVEIQRINQAELENGSVGTSASWHANYADSAWVYVGNLPIQLTEGDIICVMSQFGEVEDINLVRDDDTGKSRGFAFVKYEDARSCVLAVDNLTGSKILGRSIRVDHVEKYRLPKHLAEKENGEEGEEAKDRTAPGHAYHGRELASSFDISKGQDLFAAPAHAITGPATSRGAPAAGSNKCHKHSEEAGMTKKERWEAKRARKEERDKKRREKEARRMRKEEKRREERAKKMRKEDNNYGNDDDYYSDTHSRTRWSDKESKKKRKKKRRSRSRSRSPSGSSGGVSDRRSSLKARR